MKFTKISLLKSLPAVCLSIFLASGANAAVLGIDSVTLGGSDELVTATVGGTAYAGGTIADIAEDNRGTGVLLPLVAGDPVPSGTVVSAAEANQGFAYDNSVLTGVAGSTGNAFQNGGALVLYWGDGVTNGLTDNDSDPDFFVFEDLGNDTVEVFAILANDTVGAPITLSGWNSVSTAGDLYGSAATPIGGGGNRNVQGVSFDFTDLLDASGAPLTAGTAIKGIVIGDESSADFYEIYANVDSATLPAIPEPSTLLLVSMVAGFMAVRRR